MKKRAKLSLIIGGVVIFLLAFAFGALIAYKVSHDRTAEQMMRDVILMCEDYRSRFGKYPEKLDELRERDCVAKKVFGVFPAPELDYLLIDGGYRISFYEFPIGPFYGYESKSGEWFFEE